VSDYITDAACFVVLIIPTLNEAPSIGAAVRSVPRDVVRRIIVADGGSSDNTAACATAAGAEVLDVGPGYGRACLLATQAATDADIVVFMDGDGADDTQSIRSLVDPIRSGAADFVIGSRVRGERGRGACLASNRRGHAGGIGMTPFTACSTRTCAFRAIRRDVLWALA
jgi:glycosyltransferase involved in cell wall biosynthesis